MGPEPRLEEKEEPVQNHEGQGYVCRGVGRGAASAVEGRARLGVCAARAGR